MTDQQRATELFLACCELDPAEREAFLVQRCGEDRELLAAVGGMLAFDEQRPDFLAGRAAEEFRSAIDGLPHSIGPFRIHRKLGEGGMGVVYQAEQDSPRRTVALKILRPLFVSPDALRRFQQEGEFLGRLQHPCIAQIFDSGCVDTEHGPLPFFAMELVRGEPLTDFARQRGLSTDERLELVARIADGVEHAHQHGVIHRDLKPQNILIDSSSQPKILDFGIARATDSDVRLTTQHTDLGQVLGTLAYMSPEQAAGDPQAIDARSDVYSLGVLLYELLADRLPYDVSQESLPEAVRIIRDEEPRRLQTVKRTYRGDVDTIVRKALEKSKEDRYPSAAALAADIRRFLRNQPIAARPPSRMYTLRKFARRNRTVVVAAATIFVMLLVSLVTSLRFGLAEAAQRRIAEREIYRDKLSLALRAMDEGNPRKAKQELGAASKGLRNWEWRYLEQRLEPRVGSVVIPGLFDAVFLDEDRILAIDGACDAHIWNVLSGDAPRVRARAPRRFARERPLAFSSDGGLLLSYAEGALLVRDPLGDPTDGEAVTVLPFPGSKPLREGDTSAVAADGSRVVVATESGEVRIIEVASGESRTVPAEELLGGVRSMSIGLDGSWFAVGLGQGLHSWDLPGMEVRYTGSTALMGPAAFAPDGSALAMAHRDAISDIWVRRTGEDQSRRIRRTELGDHRSRPFSSLRYSSSGDLLAATFSDSETWIFDMTDEDGRLVSSIPCEGRNGVRVRFSPSGESLLSLGLGNHSLQVWSTGLNQDAQVLRGHTATLHAVAFSPDGATLASTAWDGSVRLWDGATGASIVKLPAARLVRPLTFSPDGRHLAWSSAYPRASAQLVIWDTTLGRVVHRPRSDSNCHALAYSGDGALLAVGSSDGRIHLWDTRTFADPLVIEAEPRLDPRPADSGIRALAHHPTRSIVASGAFDGVLTLWDSRSGARLGNAEREARGSAQHMGVNSLAFSPDGTRLAVAWGNSAVTIFEVPTLREIHVLQDHHEEVFAVAYSPDGTRIASGGRDGLLRLWDAGTGKLLITLEGHEDYIMSLAFSPDGRRIATGSGDFTVRLWDSEPTTRRRQAIRADEAARPRIEALVDELFEELGTASAVVGRLHADAELEARERRLALQAVLRHEAGAVRTE